MSLKNSENFIVLGLFLAVLGLISAVLLAVFSDIVREPIAAAELRNTNKALEQILPPFDNQPSQDKVEIEAGGSAITFMGAVKDGKLVALAARGERKGYAGPVQALVGLDVDGKIRAVLITKQNETPGLGANVCERKFKKTIFNLFQKRAECVPRPVRRQERRKGRHLEGEEGRRRHRLCDRRDRHQPDDHRPDRRDRPVLPCQPRGDHP